MDSKGSAPKKRGINLTSPEKARRLLSRLINQAIGDEVSGEKLRAISYAIRTLLKCFEQADFQQRIEEIEKKLDSCNL